jgi:uncharacterized lipoprotein YmbA
MRDTFRTPLLAATVAVLATALGGCAGSQDARFYVLSPVPASEAPKNPPSGAPPRVGLWPVELPAQLDRLQIVTRSGQNEIALAEFDLWAAPLADQVTRVLAEDLAILIPSDHVTVFPWARDTLPDYEVQVEVVRSEATLGGQYELVANWSVFKRGARNGGVRGKSALLEPAGASYATLAGAKSRLVGALGRDIAGAVQKLSW